MAQKEEDSRKRVSFRLKLAMLLSGDMQAKQLVAHMKGFDWTSDTVYHARTGRHAFTEQELARLSKVFGKSLDFWTAPDEKLPEFDVLSNTAVSDIITSTFEECSVFASIPGLLRKEEGEELGMVHVLSYLVNATNGKTRRVCITTEPILGFIHAGETVIIQEESALPDGYPCVYHKETEDNDVEFICGYQRHEGRSALLDLDGTGQHMQATDGFRLFGLIGAVIPRGTDVDRGSPFYDFIHGVRKIFS